MDVAPSSMACLNNVGCDAQILVHEEYNMVRLNNSKPKQPYILVLEPKVAHDSS